MIVVCAAAWRLCSFTLSFGQESPQRMRPHSYRLSSTKAAADVVHCDDRWALVSSHNDILIYQKARSSHRRCSGEGYGTFPIALKGVMRLSAHISQVLGLILEPTAVLSR